MTTATPKPCRVGCDRAAMVIRGWAYSVCGDCGSTFHVHRGAYQPVTKGARVAP